MSLLLTTLGLAVGLTCADLELSETVVRIPEDGSRLALREVDGDGRRDLLFIGPGGIGVRYLRAEGSYPDEHDTHLAWPGTHLAWTLVDIDGDARTEVVVLTGEGQVFCYEPDADRQLEECKLLLQAQCYIPRGISHMRFARDINGDGRPDLVLPAAGDYLIFLNSGGGEWAEPMRIAYEADVEYSVGDPGRLDTSFGLDLAVPWFRLRDVDGDGRVDLVSETKGRVDFHLADPELAATPSWSLDLEALRKAASGEGPDKAGGINLDNLLSNIDTGVMWQLADIDGQEPYDLVVGIEDTVKVYHGGSRTGVGDHADQVLKLSGNLLHFFLRDVQGDEAVDLQLVRGENISLSKVLRWLILPGSLDFELFTYQNEGGKFSRRPTRQNTVSVKIPRILSLIEDIEEIEDELDAQESIPAQRVDLDGDGTADDVAIILSGKLGLYEDCAPLEELQRFESFKKGDAKALVEDLVLANVDDFEDGETYVIDLGEARDWNLSPGAAMREACKGKRPVFESATPATGEKIHLQAVDLDGDGRSDLVVHGDPVDGRYEVQFFVLK